MQQTMLSWIETADARAALDHPKVMLVPRQSGLASLRRVAGLATLLGMRPVASDGRRTAKARLATAAVLICVLLGGGVVGFATIGTAIELQANSSQEPRFNATARCGDGTWSWSKNPKAPATFVHHGGVAVASR